MSRIYLCLLFCISLLGAFAQSETPEIWSLTECIAYAQENNLNLRQAKLQAQVERNDLHTAQWDYAPSLSLGSNYFWNFGLNIDPVTNQISRETRQTANLNLGANWLVFDGGRKFNRISQAKLSSVAAQYEYEAARNDMSLSVANAFLQILLNREIAEVAREQARISQLQVERTEKLVAVGSLPKGELLQLKAQRARDEQNLIASENAVRLSKLQLANILQLGEPDKFEIVDPELALPSEEILLLPPAALYNTALETQPAIRGAEKRYESQTQGVQLARGAYFPTLSLIGQVGSNYSNQIPNVVGADQISVPIGQVATTGDPVLSLPQSIPQVEGVKPFQAQVGDNVNELLGINLQVPIFNRYAVRNAVQNAQIRREVAQLNLEQEKNDLRQTIYQAHADALAAYRQYQAAELAVQSNEEAFKYARERFEVGAINFVDFENSKNGLARSRSERLQAKYDYIFKTQVLQFYRTNQVKLE